MSGITALVLVVVAALVFLNSGILPATDARISARAAANDALRLDLAGKNIAVYGLKRDWNYGLSYYFRRELPEWTPGKQLPEWLFTSDKNCAELERQRDRIREASRAGAPFAVLLHILPDVPNAPQ